MAGLLGTDWEDPKTQALLSLGLGLLSAGGPSRVRQTFGSALGAAGSEALQAGNAARVLKQRDEELRRRNAVVDAQLRKMQLDEQEEMEARRAVAEEARRLTTPQYPLGTSVVQLDPAKQPQNVVPTLPQFNPLEAIGRGVPLKAVATMQGLQPKPGEGYTLGKGQVRFDATGREIARGPADESDLPGPVREYQFAVSQGYKGTFEQWDRERKRAGATNVSLAVNTEKNLLGNVAEGVGKNIVAARDAAIGATDTIEQANRVRKALDTNKAITGPLADVRLSAAQLANTLGLTGPEAVMQTRAVIQGMAKMALAARSQLKGQGQVSDYEGKLLQRAETGDITMTAAEIRTIANAADRQARKLIALNRRNAESMANNPSAAVLMPYFDVPVPEEYTQQPSADEVDAALKKYLPKR